jgi:hypothetical protein
MKTPRSSSLQSPRWFGVTLVVLGALAIGILTLWPAPEPADPPTIPPLSCLICGDLGATDIVQNLLLFAPFAAGLVLLGLPTTRVFAISALISLAIETLQIKVIPGRDASVSDFLSNSLGAAMAAWVAHRRGAVMLPDQRTAGWFAAAGLAVWISLETLSGWALQPSLPATIYWGQWAPDLGFLDQFRGTVLGAWVGGEPLPPNRSPESRRLRDQLLRDGAPVSAKAISGHPPDDLAPIVSVFDGRYTEIFLLGQRGDEAFFRLRTRVKDLRLRPPAIRIKHAMPLLPGESLALAARYDKGHYSLRVEAAGKTVERTLDASPNWAWSYFMPWENYALGAEAPWLTALWVAGLLFPIGYWVGRSGSRGGSALAWLLVGLTLLLVPRIFELPVVQVSEWAAAALGLGLGHQSARWSLDRWPSSTLFPIASTRDRRASISPVGWISSEESPKFPDDAAVQPRRRSISGV